MSHSGEDMLFSGHASAERVSGAWAGESPKVNPPEGDS